MEDAGWEIRDTIAWIYSSGFPKSRNLSGEWNGWGTSLKPAFEPITIARKPLIGTVAQNVLEHGTGAINVDGCRIAGQDWDSEKVLAKYKGSNVGKTTSVTNAFGVGDIVCTNPASTVIGRWPANLIHDGGDEVVGLFPDTAPAKRAHRGEGSDGTTGIYGKYGGESTVRGHNDNGGSAARFFYCAKASRTEREAGLGGMRGARERSARNVHPTVKPLALMRYLCRLVTPLGGMVLDPFAGSGTTGIAATLEGFNFVLIEKELDYAKIAEKRIAFLLERRNNEPLDMDS
jgi:site-specific DNA-methyltransferase (adenine-specific)